jgi:hypothetical protein
MELSLAFLEPISRAMCRDCDAPHLFTLSRPLFEAFGVVAKNAAKLILLCSSAVPKRPSIQEVVKIHRASYSYLAERDVKKKKEEDWVSMEQEDQRSAERERKLKTNRILMVTGEKLGMNVMHERPVTLASDLVLPRGEIVPVGAAIVRVGGVRTEGTSMSVFVEICRTSGRPVEVEFDWSELQKSSV